MKFKLQFEFYGKRLQTTVEANSIQEAKQRVIDRINFIKVEPQDEIFDYFMNNVFKPKRP
jgi:hypothetical protein